MPATKHSFRCGHKGFGQYCHRCHEAERLKELATKAANGEKMQYVGRINLEGVVKKPGRVFGPTDHAYLMTEAGKLLAANTK